MTNEQRHKEFNPKGDIATAVAIEKVIKSFGSCESCRHFDTSLGNFPEHGYCQNNKDTEQAVWVNIETVADWFCKDFKEIEDD